MVDTKLEAYKLIHDPVHLLSLLYSKYTDIEEDFALLYSNQILYNRKSHFNICFKEQRIFYDIEEYLRRSYKKSESTTRILKLNEYYKNYQNFFCKATFTDFFIGNMLKNYQDTKAEVFYKNNYGDSSLNKAENEKSFNFNVSPSLSSLDNITYNKTIFDKKNKQIIENDDKNFSITLTSSNSFRKFGLGKGGSGNLLNTSGREESFVECVKNIVYYKKKKKKENDNDKKYIKKEKENDLSNFYKKVDDKIKRKINHSHEKIYLEKANKDNTNNKSKNLYSILNLGNSINSQSNKNIKNISHENKITSKNNNLFLSPRYGVHHISNITSRISQFQNNIPINIKYLNRNKSCCNDKNNNNNSKNSFGYISNIQPKEINLLKEKNTSIMQLKKISKEKIDKRNNKFQNSRFKQYNKFLMPNKNYKNNQNPKNQTYELINRATKIKNLTNQNSLFEKIEKSSTIYKKEMMNNGIGTKYRLFKGVNLSPEYIFKVNGQKIANRKINKKSKKYFVSSNSLENNNNMHLSSFSPKFISSNLNINNEKLRHIGINKISKVGNNTCIQNNINIINKIKIQPKQNRRSGNYNINFNNLFFYGGKIPTSYLENIRNNIINNQNKNLNNNKINTNFYMLSFNNYNGNSVDNKTNYNNFKKHEVILNLNKVSHFNKSRIGKLKKFPRKNSNEKASNIKLEFNTNKNNF